jgi:hypothetical protein
LASARGRSWAAIASPPTSMRNSVTAPPAGTGTNRSSCCGCAVGLRHVCSITVVTRSRSKTTSTSTASRARTGAPRGLAAEGTAASRRRAKQEAQARRAGDRMGEAPGSGSALTDARTARPLSGLAGFALGVPDLPRALVPPRSRPSRPRRGAPPRPEALAQQLHAAMEIDAHRSRCDPGAELPSAWHPRESLRGSSGAPHALSHASVASPVRR